MTLSQQRINDSCVSCIVVGGSVKVMRNLIYAVFRPPGSIRFSHLPQLFKVCESHSLVRDCFQSRTEVGGRLKRKWDPIIIEVS